MFDIWVAAIYIIVGFGCSLAVVVVVGFYKLFRKIWR